MKNYKDDHKDQCIGSLRVSLNVPKVGDFDGRCGRQERRLVMLVTAAFLLRAWWALRIVVYT